MPYDINSFSPTYGGVINSSGNVVNVGDTIDTANQTKVSVGKGQTSELFVFQNNATALANGNVADVSGYTTAAIEYVETGSQIISVEGSLDQVTWYALNGTNLVSSTTPSAVLNATGLFRFNLTGINFLRCRISTFTSGSAYVSGYFTSNNLMTFAPTTSTSLTSADAIGGAQLAAASAAFNMVSNGTSFDRQRSASADALAATGITAAGNMGFNGATYDRVRVGRTYKYIEYLNLPTSTGTTIWTPAAGKKFRLMGISVATSATVHLHIRDAGTIFHSVRSQGTTTSFDFGNGYLSAAANNILEVRNDSGTTTNVWVTAWGTEE